MREMDTESPVVWPAWCYSGDTPSSDSLENSPPISSFKPTTGGRRRRFDRNAIVTTATTASSTDLSLQTSTSPMSNNNNNNNNNHVKNERLSPGTPDTSRSRSVTPSSASHPDTPPASDHSITGGRNYSDIMRSLAAKYNNTNQNDYFSTARNGFPPPIDPKFKSSYFPSLLQNLNSAATSKDEQIKKNDFSTILNPFSSTAMFPPLIDMSTTQTLLAMVRTAKEAELQGLLKSAKRQETSSPLDLSAGAPAPKRPRTKTPLTTTGLPNNGSIMISSKRDWSESPRLVEDISSWNVDDVCNFVSSIDICAEYGPTFRDQQIDGTGLPLLTEEHMMNTMNMKLGPALKLKSILAKKLGSCNICLHCTHCHRSPGLSDPSNSNPGSASDPGAPS